MGRLVAIEQQRYSEPHLAAERTEEADTFETLTACSGPVAASAIPDSGDFDAGDGHVDAHIWNARASKVKI